MAVKSPDLVPEVVGKLLEIADDVDELIGVLGCVRCLLPPDFQGLRTEMFEILCDLLRIQKWLVLSRDLSQSGIVPVMNGSDLAWLQRVLEIRENHPPERDGLVKSKLDVSSIAAGIARSKCRLAEAKMIDFSLENRDIENLWDMEVSIAYLNCLHDYLCVLFGYRKGSI